MVLSAGVVIRCAASCGGRKRRWKVAERISLTFSKPQKDGESGSHGSVGRAVPFIHARATELEDAPLRGAETPSPPEA